MFRADTVRDLPVRTQAGIVWARKEARVSATSPETSIAQTTLDGGGVPQVSRAQRIALSILQGERLYPLAVGENNFECDLSAESCLLCGGFFPRVGEVRYSSVFHGPLHVGCVVEAANWAHPLTPFRRCTDWRCTDGWITDVDDSYGSLSDPEGGSLTIKPCPHCGGAA